MIWHRCDAPFKTRIQFSMIIRFVKYFLYRGNQSKWKVNKYGNLKTKGELNINETEKRYSEWDYIIDILSDNPSPMALRIWQQEHDKIEEEKLLGIWVEKQFPIKFD